MPNPKIPAYINNILVWGSEPVLVRLPQLDAFNLQADVPAALMHFHFVSSFGSAELLDYMGRLSHHMLAIPVKPLLCALH